jgi:pilus assembly protein CpaF
MSAATWGQLSGLLEDGTVSEIMVNGPGPVWVERSGALERTDVVVDLAAIEVLVERLLATSGRRVDRRVPYADARLADGSRVHVVIAPVALDGPYVTVRRFANAPRDLAAFAPDVAGDLLRWLVQARANIVVTGAAGAGKTTLLNALAGAIGARERVVTIEDAAELRLRANHVVRLEARPPNSEGAGGVSVRELLRNALRMRPDRLVIGEVRGHEAVEMLQAMSTGHDGSLATCHGSSPLDALRRIEIMVLLADPSLDAAAVREQLASAVDVVVHVARRTDGTRRVAEVVEVRPHPPMAVWPIVAADHVVALPQRPPRCADAGPPLSEWLVA